MPVKKIWNDGDNFCVEIVGSGWGIQYTFPIKELAAGASLSRMMNLKVRDTHTYSPGMVSKSELRAEAKVAVAALRRVVEPYFASRGM